MKILSRIKKFSYLKKYEVFTMDLILSLLGTFLAYIFLILIFNLTVDYTYILLCSAIVSSLLFVVFGLFNDTIRHFTYRGIIKIFTLNSIKSLLLSVYLSYFLDLDLFHSIVYFISDLLISSFVLIGVRISMIGVYYYLLEYDKSNKKNTYLYSTKGMNPIIVQQINKDQNSKYKIKGLLTTNKSKAGLKISSVPVYYVNDSRLATYFMRDEINNVIFTSQDRLNGEKDNLVAFCMKHDVPMFLTGEYAEVSKNGIVSRNIKPIQIENLLDREEIKIDVEEISSEIRGKVVLISGAAGSIGSEIARQVASYGVSQLVLYDNSETPLHNIQLELSVKYPQIDIKYVLADVRSVHRAKAIVSKYKPSIIFHAAAYKHVPMVESNPCEGVLTNIWGTINIAQRAIENGVKKFIMISTDKAVNPTNVMGASKRIAEMCVQSFNSQNKTEFVTTRFGNVLGSNGSVIPLFKEQIAKGGPITVTHPDIIRYFMTIPEACRLVLQAATMGHAGEILVFDMGKQVKIADLARKMITLSGFKPDKDIKIEYTGLRPGEKLYEELLSSEENTTETRHYKIRIAKCNPSIDDLDTLIRKLIVIARSADIDKTVALMKQICPEFRSNNSMFEKFDK